MGWTGLVLLLSLVAASAWVHDGLRLVLESRDDDALDREARELAGDVAERPRGSEPALDSEVLREVSAYRAAGLVAVVRSKRRTSVVPDTAEARLLAAKATPTGGPRTVVAGPGRRYRVLSRRSADGGFTLELALSLAETDATLARFDRLIAAGAAGFFALALAGGFVLSGLAFRPVAASSRTASRLDPANLAERLPRTGSGDELDELAATINGFLDRLAAYHAQVIRFTADASHELRGPLGAMQAAVEVTLRRQRSECEYREVLASLGEQCDRLATLVNGLLLLARADAGEANLELGPVDLSALAAEVADMFEPLAEEEGIRITSDSPSGIVVTGDPSRLRQCVTNLVDNAIRFTPHGGSVSMRVASLGDRASLRVSDSGQGIPAEHLPRIFDRFYQADPSRSSGGAGLGLSICRWIVESHGGTIDVISRPGEGACFTVTLPASGPAVGPPETTAGRASAGPRVPSVQVGGRIPRIPSRETEGRGDD